MGTHIPLFRFQALQLRLVSKHLITKEQSLIAAEKFRTGGYNRSGDIPIMNSLSEHWSMDS
jgi:hypothetical protein